MPVNVIVPNSACKHIIYHSHVHQLDAYRLYGKLFKVCLFWVFVFFLVLRAPGQRRLKTVGQICQKVDILGFKGPSFSIKFKSTKNEFTFRTRSGWDLPCFAGVVNKSTVRSLLFIIQFCLGKTLDESLPAG